MEGAAQGNPVTVVYVGNFRHRHCTESHVALSFEALGHRVVRVQEDSLHEPGGWASVPALAVVQQADLVLWTRTWQHPNPAEQTEALEQLRAMEIPSASFHLDTYVGLDREEQIGREPWWRTDVVCSADGAMGDQWWMDTWGVNHRWVRPGVLKSECVNGQRQRLYTSDVAFVGSHRAYHAEWPYRLELVHWLKRTYRQRVRMWPRQKAVRNEDLNDLYASARVIVGDSLNLGFHRPNYWSDRVYETVGRGGFLVFPFVEGLQDEFTDGVHLRFYEFGDWRGLKKTIDYYLDGRHEAERRRIVAAGQAMVREQCSYERRVEEVLGHVRSLSHGEGDHHRGGLPARLS